MHLLLWRRWYGLLRCGLLRVDCWLVVRSVHLRLLMMSGYRRRRGRQRRVVDVVLRHIGGRRGRGGLRRRGQLLIALQKKRIGLDLTKHRVWQLVQTAPLHESDAARTVGALRVGEDALVGPQQHVVRKALLGVHGRDGGACVRPFAARLALRAARGGGREHVPHGLRLLSEQSHGRRRKVWGRRQAHWARQRLAR